MEQLIYLAIFLFLTLVAGLNFMFYGMKKSKEKHINKSG